MILAFALSEHGRPGFFGHDGHYVACFWFAALTWQIMVRFNLKHNYMTFYCSFSFFFAHFFLT